MKKSPIYPRFQSEDNFGNEFDPQLDFAKFLKEARDNKGNAEVAAPNSEAAAGNVEQLGGGLKSKKSWKSSLFSWLKAEKKGKNPSMEPLDTCYTISKPRRVYFSGSIHRDAGGNSSRSRRPNSGPLTGLFNSGKRREEDYVCLDKLINNPHGVDSYGPVYLVT